MKPVGVAICAALLLTACGGPGLDQLAAGPRGVAAAVPNGDSVVLQGGQTVRLVGVESPRLGEPYADEARQALSKLVLGQQVQLMYGGARQDAYGRALAHLKLVKGGAWVERELLKAGAVRVHTYPDNRALARVMLDDEARARAAHKGLWALPLYQVRLPDEAAAKPFGFQVVEGRVVSAPERDGGVSIDLERWVQAQVPREAEGAFASAGVPLSDLPGKLIRVRGLLRPGRGEATLRLDHPEQVEVLKEPK
jgi:endonuclease YncB( thermonuclease family)